MRTVKGIFLGAIFGFCFSILVPIVFIVGFTMVVGGGEIQLWLFSITAIPFTFAFAILGYLLAKKNTLSNKKLWVYSVISSLFISYYSGTIGIVFGELIGRKVALERNTGLEYDLATVYSTIAVEKTMINGAILASILLPLTIPVQRFALNLLLSLFNKFNINIQH